MKGVIPKLFVGKKLDCESCRHFINDDPDVFYCEKDRSEFPKQCELYIKKDELYGVFDVQ